MKLDFSGESRHEGNRRRDWRGNGGKSGEQRMLLDLSDQAVVIGALRILVQ